MYRDAFGRSWSGPFPFSAEAIAQHAPRASGVYEVLAGSGASAQVAYVGIATGDTIRGRLQKHVSARGNWGLGRLGDPTQFAFVFYECDTRTAQQIESYIVTHAKPPFNTRPELRHLIPSIAVH